MCGIIGYAGPRDGKNEVLRGLSRLEYRGYDSAGLATVGPGGRLSVTRARGRVSALRSKAGHDRFKTRLAIGHTRWATHGAPDERNAHPHVDCGGTIAVVHNGIIGNATELRAQLLADGHALSSDTDSECVAHLVEAAYQGDLLAAVGAATSQITGTYALAVVATDQRCIVAARRGSPLIIGVGDGEYFLASDATALLQRTRDVVYLQDDHFAVIRGGALEIFDVEGRTIPVETTRIGWSVDEATRGSFDTFMRKEIDEQPAAVARCLRGRIDAAEPLPVRLPELESVLLGGETPRRIVLAACGTSYHASLIAKEDLQAWCGLPVEVQVASELRLGTCPVGAGDLLVAVSQSGETADTLACAELAKRRSVPVIAVCNVEGSALARAADATLLTRAGPEISVASTKAFVTQVVTLRLVAAALAQRVNHVNLDVLRTELAALSALPDLLRALIGGEAQIAECAHRHADSRMFAYLGRGRDHAVALEGALKLAELSYLPAVGYAAGEIKHGPLAMVDPAVTVVCLIDGAARRKMAATIAEVGARAGRIIAIGPNDDPVAASGAESFIGLPVAAPSCSPLLRAVALQLLAYHVALRMGRDIDHPRNLAKSVTVE